MKRCFAERDSCYLSAGVLVVPQSVLAMCYFEQKGWCLFVEIVVLTQVGLAAEVALKAVVEEVM